MQDFNTNKKNDSNGKGKVDKFLDRYFYLVTIIIIVVLLGAGYLAIIKPKYDYARAQVESAEANEKIIYNQLTTYKDNIQKYYNFISNLGAEDIEKMQEILPERKTYDEVYSEFELLTQGKGLKLASLETTDEGEIKPIPNNIMKVVNGNEEEEGSAIEKINRVRLKVEIENVSYVALKSLLNDIEKTLRLMDVEKLEYKPDESKVSMEVVTYYYNP